MISSIITIEFVLFYKIKAWERECVWKREHELLPLVNSGRHFNWFSLFSSSITVLRVIYLSFSIFLLYFLNIYVLNIYKN